MDFIECIEFANNNTLCYLATTERRQPHVEAFRMWFADEKGFHFITQLKDYPRIEQSSHPFWTIDPAHLDRQGEI